MIETVKAVIFDLDGTLVDSMWMWPDIDIGFLKDRGFLCPPELEKEVEGMSFSETAAHFKKRFGLKETEEEIKQIWMEMSIDKYRSQVPLKPGAGEFLDHLSDRNILMGIATSNGREMVDAVIDSLGIGKYFKVIATSCEVAEGKPSPDIYLKVAGELSVKPCECLVFEDVPAGILAGKRAGMKVCAIEDDFSRHMEAEKRELADYYIRDYFDILNENNRS